jgi:hypothetical protein
LRPICDSIERQLGWNHCKLNIVQRKNRLLTCLGRRAKPVAFDHVALTPPRVSRFMARLGDQIPIWIICRSTLRGAIGHVWEHLYKFTRVEIPPLSPSETRRLICRAVNEGHIQPDSRVHARELHRMSKGNPRVLEELLIELAAGNYKMDTSFGLNLLALDREIHQFDVAVESGIRES